MSSSYGWEWVQEGPDSYPEFTVEIDTNSIEYLARQALNIPLNSSCTVTSQAEGGFNKIFKIEYNGTPFIMRVGLPFQAPYKVLSEVATTNYLRSHTSMPIPRIFAYDASTDNPLRFPWSIIEFIHGDTLYNRFDDLSMDQKAALTRQIAAYQVELFNLRFEGIGSLYQVCDNVNGRSSSVWLGFGLFLVVIGVDVRFIICLYIVGAMWSSIRSRQSPSHTFRLVRLSSVVFVHNPTIPSHGPYPTTHDWFRIRLAHAYAAQQLRLPDVDVEEVDYANKVLAYTERVSALLDTVCPIDTPHTTSTINTHDMSSLNIMIDEQGNLTGLLDWEFITTSSLGLACHIPDFIDGPDFKSEPPKRNYPRDWTQGDDGVYRRVEGRTGGYMRDWRDWERTLLRKVFLEEMDRLDPRWGVEYKRGMMLSEYLFLVQVAESGWIGHPRVETWLNRVEKGKWREGFLDEKEDLSGRPVDEFGDYLDEEDAEDGEDEGDEEDGEDGEDGENVHANDDKDGGCPSDESLSGPDEQGRECAKG